MLSFMRSIFGKGIRIVGRGVRRLRMQGEAITHFILLLAKVSQVQVQMIQVDKN